MPQRRSFNPEPMNRPEILPHGRQMTPPNLEPQPQGLPPSTQAQPQQQMPTSAGAALPSSIPMRPPTMGGPPPPQQTPQASATPTPMPTTGGTISPLNAHPFLDAQSGLAAGENANDQGSPLGDHSALLKLLAVLGHGGPDATA